MTSRAKLLAMVALFLAPLVTAAVVFFAFPQWWPSGRLNHGALIDPARPLPALDLVDADGKAQPLALREKWNYVYLAGQRCDEICDARLRMIRQVRLLMGDKGVRLRYVYLAPDAAALAQARQALSAEHPSMLWVADTGAAGHRAEDFFTPTDPRALYLVDPAGNWLMVYAGDADAKGVMDDIKKLLRYSHIG